MRALLLAGALACAAALPLRAGVIAVYAPAPADIGAGIEALRAAALGSGAREGFTVKTSSSCSLSADFSVPAGHIAYFRADATLEMLPGFEMLGESVLFESAAPGEPAGKRAAPGEEVTRVFPTALRSAARTRDGIRLGYALAAPARVSAEAYTASGRVVASREWSETAAGAFERSLPVAAAAGPLFVRWKTGNVTAILKVPSSAGR
jgi:hypothetical protein